MKISMADITNKSIMHREAVAFGKISLKEETIKKIKNKQIKKGDPIQISVIAGINAAKMTSQLMPLCHNIGIEEINITPTVKKTHIELLARVKSSEKTGLEMEALTAVTTALLNIWDITKQYEKNKDGQYPTTAITEIKILKKMKKKIE